MSLPESPMPTPAIVAEVQRAVEELDLESVSSELDRNPRFPRELFRALGDRRLLGLLIPERLGGRGLPLTDGGAALYWMAHRSGATAFSKMMLQPEFCSVLAEHGSEVQRESAFRSLCRGERLIGNQLTEPGAGSDLAGLEAAATRTPSGGYLLQGTKSGTAFAEDADEAIVYAQVPMDSNGAVRLSAFLVPQRLPGIRRTVLEDLGERWMRRGTVQYDAVPLDAGTLIGEEGRALEYVRPELTRERALLSLVYLGLARRSLEELVQHAGVRQTFGSPLSAHQGVAFPIVEDWFDADVLTVFALRTLARLENSQRVEGEAAMLKVRAVEVALRTLDHAVQFHGGRGYSRELPFERRWRDVRSGAIAHGSSEIMRLAAGRAIWRPPRPPAPITRPRD